MAQSPKKSLKKEFDKTFNFTMPHDGYERVIDDVLETMEDSIRDVVATLDLSIFGTELDLDTAVEALQPMIVSMQDSLIDVIGELEYDAANTPRDWIRHQYDKEPIPNDALGHFTGIEDVRDGMEKLAERIKMQMSYMDTDGMDPQRLASIKLSIGFISGLIDKILDRVNDMDNKAGFETLKKLHGGKKTTPARQPLRNGQRLLPPPGM